MRKYLIPVDRELCFVSGLLLALRGRLPLQRLRSAHLRPGVCCWGAAALVPSRNVQTWFQLIRVQLSVPLFFSVCPVTCHFHCGFAPHPCFELGGFCDASTLVPERNRRRARVRRPRALRPPPWSPPSCDESGTEVHQNHQDTWSKSYSVLACASCSFICKIASLGMAKQLCRWHKDSYCSGQDPRFCAPRLLLSSIPEATPASAAAAAAVAASAVCASQKTILNS
jgi:hypothetical protein